MALIDQKSGDRQGQANYVLYSLAASNTSLVAAQPSPAWQPRRLPGPRVVGSCYFHDISATPNPNGASQRTFLTANTSVPCTGTATGSGTFTDTNTDPASNSENCYGYEITVTEWEFAYHHARLLRETFHRRKRHFARVGGNPGLRSGHGSRQPERLRLINAPEWSGHDMTTESQPFTANRSYYLGRERQPGSDRDRSRSDTHGPGGHCHLLLRKHGSRRTQTQECAPGGVFSLQITGWL